MMIFYCLCTLLSLVLFSAVAERSKTNANTSDYAIPIITSFIPGFHILTAIIFLLQLLCMEELSNGD